MTRTCKNCREAQIDKRAGQSRFQRSTATVTKWARKTHNPSVVGSSPTCPTVFLQVSALSSAQASVWRRGSATDLLTGGDERHRGIALGAAKIQVASHLGVASAC